MRRRDALKGILVAPFAAWAAVRNTDPSTRVWSTFTWTSDVEVVQSFTVLVET